MATSRKTLYLIDGHGLAYRTYFALTAASDSSRWVTKSGEPTAGTYGFAVKMLDYLAEAPDYLAVSFDVGKTFRDDLFPSYKGTREKMPDDLRVQIDRIRDLVAAFNAPILTAEGYEADDVLGTVARSAAKAGVQVVIITGDRDLLQLADDGITIRLAGQKLKDSKDYGPAEVQERFGLTPTQYIDYKALVGDTSDNIPGVSGVGDKTATELLQKYGSLDSIYEHMDEVANRFKSKLETGRESAALSKKLATIVTDVPLAFELEACAVRPLDRNRLFELFRLLEFSSLLKRLPGSDETPVEETPAPQTGGVVTASGQMGLFAQPVDASANPAPTEAIIVDDAKGLEALVRDLSSARGIAFDVETDALSPVRSNLVGISLAVREGQGYYIPVGHREGKQLPLGQVVEALRKPLTDPKIPKHGHNIDYDFIALARAGIRVEPLGVDTMLAEWLTDPASHSLGLKKLALVRLGVEMTEITELIGTGKKQITMDLVSIERAAPYAAADADLTLRLVPVLMNEVSAKRQAELLRDLEMPLIPVLADMEMAGIAIDAPYLSELGSEIQTQLQKVEADIYHLVGYSFNINSTQQLSEALFGKLGLRPPDRSRKTAAGKFSTASDVLEDLRDRHPVINLIFEQRELSKLKSTYVDALPNEINPTTGRIHTSFNQAGAVTGRISSSEPNLQNIPIRTELGRRVRRAFVAAPGTVLISADYSQIELRIAAHVSDDPVLKTAFAEGQDIHTATAAAVLGLKPEQVSKDQRRQAKTINFGLLYGMGSFMLSRQAGLTLSEADEFIKQYFARFPRIREYLDGTKAFAATNGYVQTLIGRRRYFPGLTGDAGGGTREAAIAKARAEREAINAPIQGTAADIVKRAMLNIGPALDAAGVDCKLLLQVHDELVFECRKKDVKAASAVIREIMEGAFTLSVPLGVEVRSGLNWDEMK